MDALATEGTKHPTWNYFEGAHLGQVEWNIPPNIMVVDVRNVSRVALSV
jgi:hypothetical protein